MYAVEWGGSEGRGRLQYARDDQVRDLLKMGLGAEGSEGENRGTEG